MFIAAISVFLMANAQSYSCDSVMMELRHPTGSPYFTFRQSFSVKTSDGNVLTCIPAKTLLDHQLADFGDWLYKVDHQSLTVLDSAFVETNNTFGEDNQNVLLAKAPDGNGYILAKLLYNKLMEPGLDGYAWLRISHIDEALNMQPHEEALTVLLEDAIVVDKLLGIVPEGDQIVLMYMTDLLTPVVTRIGLDGVLHEKTAFDNLFQLENVMHGLAVYNERPLEYAIYDWEANGADTCLVYHVLDSLFTLKETIVMEAHQGDIYPVQPWQYPWRKDFHTVHILPLDDGTFIEAFRYERHNITRNGACLLKYDKTTHECLAQALFESWPFYLDPEKMGYPIGMVKTVNDDIYFAYRTNNNIIGGSATTKGWLGFAKLDSDLNILWQRYCLGSSLSTGGYMQEFCHVSQCEDGFAIIGKIQKEGEDYNFFYYFIHDEDPADISEADAFLRPYMYYPNPAQDQLRLQYSPDVQPEQIELYDMQGRLVHTQKQGLENVNMHGLSAGQYLMKVTLEDGKTFSDKVVKE